MAFVTYMSLAIQSKPDPSGAGIVDLLRALKSPLATPSPLVKENIS